MQEILLKNTRWKTLEILGYYTIFMLHKIALFQVTSRIFYGQIGSILGITFFFAFILMLGFEGAAGPLYYYWSSSRNNFKSFFINHVLITTIFATIIVASGIALAYYFGQPLTLACVAGGIILLETSRKMIKTIIQLLFKNYLCALIELASILCYVVAIWTLYFMGTKMSFSLLLVPLLGLLAATVCAYLIILIHWYTTLPKTAEVKMKAVANNRLFLFFHQSISQIFSNNILVPFIAFKFGFAVAGSYYIISSFVSTIKNIIHKIYGSTRLAFFSQTRSTVDPFFSSNQKKQSFVIFLLIWFFCSVIFFMKHSGNVLIASVCFFLLYIEYGIAIQEKKLIVSQQSHLLMIIHAFVPLWLIGFLHINATLEGTLIGITGMRFCALMILTTVMHLKNKSIIKPNSMPSPQKSV